MADERIPITYTFDAKANEIRRKKGKGDEIVEDKVVAKYDPETQVVVFPNLNYLKNFKTGVITFLAENEMLVKSFQRGDMTLDKPLSKKEPPRPKKTKKEGDKTPAVVDWYFKYKPNEFATRYGVLGTYTGPVSLLEPTWRPRPVDGLPEYRGAERVEDNVVNAIVANRSVCAVEGKRLTYLPEECLNWDEEESEPGEEAERGVIVVRKSKEDDEGGDE